MKNVDIDSYFGISMRDFLTNYANLEGNLTEDIISFLEVSKATHKTLTDIGMPYIKRVPQEIVTEEDILSGDIIIVYDFKSSKKRKRPAPYRRPELVKKEMEAKLGMNNEQMNNDIRKKELRYDQF